MPSCPQPPPHSGQDNTPMITQEHFVPEHGLDLAPYVARNDVGAVHHLIRYHWALAVLADLEPRTLLDVACGAGYGAYAIARQFPRTQVLGVDYDSDAVEHARAAYDLPNLRFQVGDLTRWDETIGPEKLDCVITFDTLEHIAHREIMMESLVRHLAPGGSVLLSTPCCNPANILVPDWEHHRIEYAPGSLYDFLRRYFNRILRPDDDSLPHREIFARLRDTGIDYAAVLNPVVLQEPIILGNPYDDFVCDGMANETPAPPPPEPPVSRAEISAPSELSATDGQHLGPIEQSAIVQRIRVVGDRLCGLSLWFGTCAAQVNGSAIMTLLNRNCTQPIRRASLDLARVQDNTWQTFWFDPVPDSAGQTYCLRIELEAADAPVTLWAALHDGEVCTRDGAALDRAACFRPHYAHGLADVLDQLLFRGNSPAAVDANVATTLDNVVRMCVAEGAVPFLRLAHIADAFARTHGVRRVLSIGCGSGLHEAFLAGRLPDLDILATDIDSRMHKFPFANLRFETRDILRWPEAGQYDFVFSIECLEHIAADDAAFRNMAAKVAPGGYFYISVPFASVTEQQDPVLRRREWETHGHHRPGFAFADLDRLCRDNRIDVLHWSNMFSSPLVFNVDRLLEKIDPAARNAAFVDFARLLLTDVNDRRCASQRGDQVTGIRVLGRKGS
jgi:2-polyprenyl-3-methyl-5-hydroxy-6-metoxy-1,4-benzoquinol methylase